MQSAALYDGELLRHTDNAVIQLNPAVAISMATNPETGLRLLEPLAGELSAYAPFHLARADLFRRTGRTGLAGAAYRAALNLPQNQVERDFIFGQNAALDEQQSASGDGFQGAII